MADVFADVFTCARCGTTLTAAVSRVALPVHAHQSYGHELLPALLESGTYAVDPEPSGPPWRLWGEIGPEEAEARGVFAPVPALSFGAPGAVVVAPGDTRGTVPIPERCDGYCIGLDGRDGPNLACAQCGQPVATRIDDCSLWQAVRLAPDAVRRRAADVPARPIADWAALVAEGRSTPPDDPPPMHPWSVFRPDPDVFLHTLARLPTGREPWLRRLYDHVRARPYGWPF
ncbi:hypothetical protein ACQEU8_34260 [Streptomyces sp. CA-250714]|uniref:hypothetical protein n=1 Tax=Streptomyces sp. CA-250714 TaxID=3240060 RepID=UPI003D950479